jgi:antitoxin component of MazEF toxin-antitoxin module
MPVFESSRKVQLFGSSLALTLPALFVKACEIRKGAEMGVLFGLDGVLVVSEVMEPEALREGLLLILEDLEERVAINKDEKGHNSLQNKKMDANAN